MTTTFEKIKAVDFHVDTLERVVRQLNGGHFPNDALFQLETTFDDESVFRHFDYLGLRNGVLTSVHIDELPVGVHWYASVTPVSRVTSVEIGQSTVPPSYMAAEDDFPPAHAHGFPRQEDLTLMLSIEGRSLVEMEPLACEDPHCEADHGMVGGTKNEGIAITFQEESENSTASEAMAFVGVLAAAMGQK